MTHQNDSEQFQYHGNKNSVKITKDGKKCELIESNRTSIYGSNIIPNTTNKIYKWRFKCHKYQSSDSYDIGLDSAQNSWYNDAFYWKDNSISYGFSASGDSYDCGKIKDGATTGWIAGDEILMVLDGNNKTLCIYITNKHQEKSLMKLRNNLQGYKMGIYMENIGDSIELIRFEESAGDKNDDDAKEKESSSMKVNELEVYSFFSIFCDNT